MSDRVTLPRPSSPVLEATGLWAMLRELGASLELIRPGIDAAGQAARRLAELDDGPPESRHALDGAADAAEQALTKLAALQAAVEQAARQRRQDAP